MNAIDYLRAHRPQSLERLQQLLRIPSVSAQPAHGDDCRRAAGFLVEYFKSIGLRGEVAETGGHPAAVGFWTQAGNDAPRVLLYGHYDVQPAEPLDLWICNPFAAEVRERDAFDKAVPGGVLIARGSADNKGQHLAMLAGVEAVLATSGRLPVNLKVVIEGEEEIGSPHLADLIRRRADEFAADVVVLADASLDSLGRPTIVTSARGLVYTFITIRGPRVDLHSGEYGGVAANPANGLARLIAGLHDATGRITLEGFYDGVEELDSGRRAQLEKLPFTEADIAAKAGVAQLGGGETGRSFIERRWYRPTCDVNGLAGGYQGPGAKTIIPSMAQAKVSFRLVGRQDPDRVVASFRKYLAENCPAGLTVELEVEHPCRAYQAETSGPAFAAMAQAIRAVTGGEPTWAGAGGTIPIMADFRKILGAESVYLGLAREDCFLHAPNEQMNVADYFRGAELSAEFWPRLAM